jgi:hypothetical protein
MRKNNGLIGGKQERKHMKIILGCRKPGTDFKGIV